MEGTKTSKGKFYAVAVGRVPGVYDSWAKASQQVTGFPRACYKSFFTEADALSFIKEVNE